MSGRPLVFISHISEERTSAAQLKLVLSRDFQGLINVFVSSESIGAGEEWRPRVDTALRECGLFIVLCSPESVTKPWINHEVGAVSLRKGVPVVPVCHLGLSPRNLTGPLSGRQAIAVENADDLKSLYWKVAEVIKCQMPDRDFEALRHELRILSAQPAPKLSRDREMPARLKASLGSAKRATLMPDEAGINLGVSLFAHLAGLANRGNAIGISYGGFIAFLHDGDDFRGVAGRNYLPSDSDVAVRAAWQVTQAAGGRKEVARSGYSISAGMDTFIWSTKSPFDRTPLAWNNPLSNLPYTRDQWLSVFPDGTRRLITTAELRLVVARGGSISTANRMK
jgi:hypothetical protein